MHSNSVPKPAAASRTILVVEDETLIRLLAADSLEESGYRVLEAADATEALRILEEHDEVDVLFTDVNMPGPLDGLDLAGMMHDRRPDLARLPLSSIYLAKPYRPHQLAAAVEKQTLH